ncbi:MAG: hypothetical protein HY941_00935, partial [Gammaproteobacteria bacterium]|nr:hypothetical protein [Gammaproteobacteria bacterium]
MSTIEQYYSQAELALAAYANLLSGIPNTTALQDDGNGMSAAQAAQFAQTYTVVTQYTDTSTSFSATVFKDAAGNLTLAMRGTLEGGDFIPTDADIASYGAGYDQIAAMYNWWQRAASPAGQNVDQYEVQFVPIFDEPPAGALSLYLGTSGVSVGAYYLVSSAPAVATGELANEIASDADHRLAVAGHSLGGHLAMAFGALFPDVAGQITTFNAPGFLTTSTNEAFFAALDGTIPAGVNTTNVIADEADVGDAPWSAIAGLHGRLGVSIDIAIENQWLSDEPDSPAALNHSQQTLTDALAVYATLAGLDPALSADNFKSILDSAAMGTAASLEQVVDALEGLFGLNTDPLPGGNANRDALYQAIYAIQGSATYQSAVQSADFAQVVSLASLSSDQLAELAQSDIAYRYALAHLLPFAISTGDTALYAPHNANGELNLENYSDQYLNDRADFLMWMLRFNTRDDAYTTSAPLGATLYRDQGTGIEVQLANTHVP